MRLHRKLKGQDCEIKSSRWSNNEEYIVTVSRDKSVWVWSVADSIVGDDVGAVAIHNGHTGDVKDAVFSPDGLLVASASFDGTVKIWETTNESAAVQTLTEHDGTVWSLAFNPETGDLATIGEDGKAILYENTDEGFKLVKELILQDPLEPLYSVVFCDGQWIICGSEQKIFYVDEEFDGIAKTVTSPQLRDLNVAVPCPTHHEILAVGSDDGTVYLVST
jgi:WD40 repeat protein